MIYLVLLGALAGTVSMAAYTLMGNRANNLVHLAEPGEALQAAALDATAANEAKSRFLGRVSHDLRAPLNAVIGFAHLLANDTEDPLAPSQLKRIQYVQFSTQRLMELIDEVIEMTRGDDRDSGLQMQPILPLSLVNDAVSQVVAIAAAKGIELHTQVPAHESTLVLADRRFLLDVLVQLLTNAVIYNRPRGSVKILTVAEAEFVRLSVIDSGAGIKDADIADLFEPLSRLPEAEASGTARGLGLTIAKSLVENMGGRLEATSALGRGSTFMLVLPQFQAPTSD